MHSVTSVALFDESTWLAKTLPRLMGVNNALGPKEKSQEDIIF